MSLFLRASALLLVSLAGCVAAAPDPIHLASDSGDLHLMLDFDAPLAVGDNAFDLYVVDGSDNAVSGLMITVVPWMPAHGHGASMDTLVTDQTDGHYLVQPYFQMGGMWELQMTLDDGVNVDTATPTVEVLE